MFSINSTLHHRSTERFSTTSFESQLSKEDKKISYLSELILLVQTAHGGFISRDKMMQLQELGVSREQLQRIEDCRYRLLGGMQLRAVCNETDEMNIDTIHDLSGLVALISPRSRMPDPSPSLLFELKNETKNQIFLRKLLKSAGIFSSTSLNIALIVHSKHINPRPYIFYMNYLITDIWLMLNIEKEWFSGRYLEQSINKKKLTFKIVKHFLCNTLGGTIFLDVYNVHRFCFNHSCQLSNNDVFYLTLSLLVIFKETIFGYYVLFDNNNHILSFLMKTRKKQMQKAEEISCFLDQSISFLFEKTTKFDREKHLKVLYQPDAVEISLLELFDQLKTFSSEKIETSSRDRKKLITQIFSLLVGATFCTTYIFEKFFLTLFPNEHHKTTGSIESILNLNHFFVEFTTSIIPLFVVNAMIIQVVLDSFISLIYENKKEDFLTCFFSKTTIVVLIVSCSLSALALDQEVSYNASDIKMFSPYYTPKTLDLLKFAQTLNIISNYITSAFAINFVSRSLLIDYLEFFGNNEQKDMLRVLNLLTVIQKTIKNIRPECADDFFGPIEKLLFERER